MWEIIKFETLFGTIGSAAISLACWSYNVDDVVTIRAMFIVIVISFAIIWGCVIRIYQLKDSAVEPFFRVVRHDGSRILFKTNLHTLLSVGSYVSLYKKENDFLRFTGLVLIENIQQNVIQGAIQVSDGASFEIHDENIVIKPILRMENIQSLNRRLDSGDDSILW